MKRMNLFFVVMWFCQVSVYGAVAQNLNVNNQLANQQTDKERQEAERHTKQHAKEEEKRAKQLASKKACPFAPVRPIPEGKAVIYLFKAPYGRGAYPILANGELITYLQKGGYYAHIVSPGTYQILTNATGFLGTPTTVVTAEAGKEYYLELTTRFSAEIHVLSEENGLKKVRDDLLLLPYKKYVREFERMWQVEADPAFSRVREHYPENWKKVPPLKDLVGRGRKFEINISFGSGVLSLAGVSEEIRLVVLQYGFAADCSDPGVPSNSENQ